MPEAARLAATVIAAGLIAWLGTGALIPLLRRAAVLDRPNERSLHLLPVPRGGGLAVVAAIVAAWLWLIGAGVLMPAVLAVLLGALLLAAVSWVDDRRGLPPALRLAVQFAAVALVLGVLIALGVPLLPWRLPVWVAAPAVALLWMWFVNLFNFMDGIDGLAGSEAAAIGIGLALFGSIGIGHDPALAAAAAAIAAAALGFLWWNWAPAKIFLGDVGSVPLGYLLGFALLSAVADRHWKIALILPLYFLADATITLLRRLLRGERVWQPHRRHFYQQAVTRGLSHAAVVRRVILADVLLVALGWASENGAGLAALAAAAATVLVLLLSLAGSLPRYRAEPIPAANPHASTPQAEEPPS
ncbi:MAG: MraY family glycosyltransferase [Thiohalocapsa sp.]